MDLTKRVSQFLKENPLLSFDQIQRNSFAAPEGEDPLWSLSGKSGFSKNLLQMLLFVRNVNRRAFHAVCAQGACVATPWNAAEHNPKRELQGGGVMNVIRDTHLEKSSVNISVVHGPHYPGTESEFAQKPFAAVGVSLISHPKNPFAPIMHLNVRCIRVQDGEQEKVWMGGGADLTPMVPFAEDTDFFHAALEEVCQRNPQVAHYQKFKQWADEYFYIPHRKEIRGVGGIFFDFIPVKNPFDLNLLSDLGQYAARTYATILERRIPMPYTEEDQERHWRWRGRYAEFNLVYDRGTRFGLLSGGNHEAIFCSLPPLVKW